MIFKKKKEFKTLDYVLALSLKMLHQGAHHFLHPFHQPVLATSSSKGVTVRTVILREFLREDRILICHSDVRAPKIEQIRHYSSVSWIFYHPKEKIQLRLSGHATVHTDDQLANEQWAGTRITSRLNYCTTNPPGTPEKSPTTGLPEFLLQKSSELLTSSKGRKNFAVIACRFDFMDWLVLRATGNLRAQFTWKEGHLKATWVVP